jgi:uncharacterized protein (DUF2147 family)
VIARCWLAAALAVLACGPAAATDLTGTWLTEGGLSHVRVAPCGRALCATVVWTVRAAQDVNNPDPSQRTRPMVGIRLVSDAQPQGGAWVGRLYNPLDGRTYTGRMRLADSSHLELSGCVLLGLICKSQTWARVR